MAGQRESLLKGNSLPAFLDFVFFGGERTILVVNQKLDFFWPICSGSEVTPKKEMVGSVS